MILVVFHVSALKQFKGVKGDVSQPYIPLLLLTNEKGPLLHPIYKGEGLSGDFKK